MKHLSPAAAGILSRHAGGGLWLDGLTNLSEELASQLVKHPLLSLNGIESVSDSVARILSTHVGGTLSLRKLRGVSDAGFRQLCGHPDIELPTPSSRTIVANRR